MPAGPGSGTNVTGIASQQVTPVPGRSVFNPLSFGEMIGRVAQWNPNVPTTMIREWINEAYRSIIGRRMWYGLMVRGQVVVPNVYSTGTVTVTQGSTDIVGVGTAWTNAMALQQLRVGFNTGFYNIKTVNSATDLTLDLPWGGPTQTSVGYSISQVWVTLGPNVKSILEMVNQRQGYRLYTQIPQTVLNKYDTWRTTTGWTFLCCPKEATVDGQPQFELYPAPTFQQAFPFLSYIQPPDMVNDGDFPYPFFRPEALMNPAIANSLLFRGPKENKYYDPSTAKLKIAEAAVKVDEMWNEDDSLYMKNLTWDYGSWPYSRHGSAWLQSHAGEIDEDF